MKKNIQNRGMRNETLNIRGTSYKGDHEGVFAMEVVHADQLLLTPGWANCGRAPEEPPAASTFDPVAAMAAGPTPELAAVQSSLDNAMLDMGRLEQRLQTSEAARADLTSALQRSEATCADKTSALQRAESECAELIAAAKVDPTPPPAAPVRPETALVPPGPGEASAPVKPAEETATKAAQETGPDLESMDKPALFEAAEKWKVELTATQKKLGVEKLRAVLDEAIYGGGGGEG